MQLAISERYLDAAGLRVHCLEAGDAGSPIILLHGGGLDSAGLSWRYAVGPLAEGHRVFAPDLPGYGQSAKPDVEYSFDFYVGFVGQLLDTLGLDQASLVGLSLGGGAALGFALRSPERVSRLALVDSYGLGGEAPFGALTYLMAHAPLVVETTWALTAHSRWLVEASLRSNIFGDPEAVTAELVDEVSALAAEPGAGRAFSSFQRSEAGFHGLRTDFSERLGELTAPTLVIHGEADRLVPVAWARRAHERIVGSQLAILPGCGHWPPREQPEEFARAVVDFLSRE
jgi:pimeloyl-ACP methyl ester carboxylesterase